MSKRILVSVTNDLNQDQRMHRICETLHNSGYDVILVGRQKPNSSKLLNHDFKQVRLHCLFNSSFLFYLEYNIRLFLYALKVKPEVYYAVDLDTLPGMGLAVMLRNGSLIHDAHEYFVEVPELEGKAFKKKVWNSIGAYFISKCNLCITVNQELADILSKKYNNQFEVIRSVPKTIPSKYKSEDPREERKIVLYQGVLNKGRGLEESIQAIIQMEEDIELRIAGEGDISSQLRALVDEIDVHNKVKFLGWLNPEELKAETNKAHLGLNLLTATSENYKYSLANKFFDYIHAEVPSLNMNFPVYSRICETYKVGLCINDLKPETIQKAIRSIITNDSRYQEFQSECRRAKSIFNWEKESQHLISLVNQII